MPVPLQVHEDHDHHEAADVKAAAGGVEPDVRGHRSGRERTGNAVRMLGDEPTPVKFFEHASRLHGTKLGRRVSNCQPTQDAAALVSAGAAR